MCNHDHSAERQVYEMGTNEKISCCIGFKNHGNRFFREGQISRALEKFQMILAYFEYCFPEEPEQEKILEQLRIMASMNSSLCYLLLNKYRESLNTALQLTEEYPQNPKCWFRAAQAFNRLDSLDEAMSAINRARELSPHNVDVLREERIIVSKVETAKSETIKNAQAMFSKTKSLPDGAEKVPRAPIRNPTSVTPSNKSMVANQLWNPPSLSADFETLVSSTSRGMGEC